MKLSEDTHNNDVGDSGSSVPRKFSKLFKMKQLIEQASEQVHSYILESLRKKHVLMDHMYALKQFLLLGQGDFFAALMDGIYSEYGFHDNNGKIVYRYNVASIVDTALRNTNANDFDHHIVGRLHVKLQFSEDGDDDTKYLFGSPEEGSKSVWDLFCFEYSLPDLLVAVVDTNCMQDYKELFLYLFSVKRIEYMLHTTWRQSAILQHALAALQRSLRVTAEKNAVEFAGYAQASILLRQISMTRQAITHFVVNLKNYLFFEVLEGEWKRLFRNMEAASTLDEVVAAHADYLATIKRKSMLPMSSDTGESMLAPLMNLGEQLNELLKLAMSFCDFQNRLFASKYLR